MATHSSSPAARTPASATTPQPAPGPAVESVTRQSVVAAAAGRPVAAGEAGPAAGRPTLTVGFDLDMTLIDSRPGIRAAYEALAELTGTYVDAALAVTRLGPPLEEELAHWFPAERIEEMGELYRRLYPVHAIHPTVPMPGAREALAAVRAVGGQSVVVTAKHEPNARLHLDHLGMEPDAVVGFLWAEAKARALRAYGASVYVGDHLGDVRGARTAGALSVAVATGPCGVDELRTAGADVVLDDLTQFPAWLDHHLAPAA